MKSEYPNYKENGGVDPVEAGLSSTNDKIYRDYMNFVGGSCGERKLEQYRLYFLQFIDIVEKPLDKITKTDLEAFGSLVNKSGRSVPTKNQIKMTVKRFVKWFYKDTDMLDALKSQKILVNREKINKSTLLKPDEILAMFKVAGSFRNQAMLSLLEESAGRPEEVRTLKWNAINFEDRTVTLYSNKTKQSRTIPIDNSIDRLDIWKKNYFFEDVSQNDYIFPSQVDRSSPLSSSFFTNLIKSIGRKAGIQRTITPYNFRHTRLTELYNQDVGDIVHRKYAGHTSDSKMTAVYVAMDDKDMLQKVRETYKTKSLPPEKKEKMQEEIDALKKQVMEMNVRWLEDRIKREELEEEHHPSSKKKVIVKEYVLN